MLRASMTSPQSGSSARRVEALGQRSLQLWARVLRGNNVEVDEARWPIDPKYSEVLGHGNLANAAVVLAAKAAKSLKSILLLCKRDLGEDAATVMRSLIESLAILIYVCRTDSWCERLTRYLAHINTQNRTWINRLNANPALQQLPSEDLMSWIDSGLRTATDLLGAEALEQIARRGMLPSGVEGVLRECGLGSLYDGPYRMAAQASHALDIGSFGAPDADGRLELRGASLWTDSTRMTSVGVFLDVLVVFSRVAQYGSQAQVLRLRNELNELTRPSG